MDLGQGMAETVAPEMPDAAATAANRWLPEAELAVYAEEYGRTGFQGGLNWYRCRTTGRFESEAQVFAGRSIDIPAIFIAGAQDWGIEQVPGALRRMPELACTRMGPVQLVPGAGHWVQQEQPEAVVSHLLAWLAAC
jgi:pimeloyl-ACP methyl ester carboxylesterase